MYVCMYVCIYIHIFNHISCAQGHELPWDHLQIGNNQEGTLSVFFTTHTYIYTLNYIYIYYILYLYKHHIYILYILHITYV